MHRPCAGARRHFVASFPSSLLCLCACGLALVAGRANADEEPHAHEHEHGNAHEEIESIVVTASPLDHEAGQLALPVDQLDRDQIIDQLGATVGDTLRNVPGVTSSGFSAGASRPVIRGQDAFRTEVVETGLSTQDASRLSPDHAIPVNPLTAESIEVVRGPGVLRYGGGASAGVVNVITNRVPKEPLYEPIRGEIVGIYGENADERDLSALLEGGIGTGGYGELAWHFDTLLRKSDDYETGGGGKQDGTDTQSFSASGGASWFGDHGRIGVAYTRVENKYGIPEEGEPVTIDMKTNRVRFEGDLDEPFAGLRGLQLRAAYSDYTHDEKAEGVVGQTFDNEEFDGRLEALHEEWLGFVGAIGAHGKHQDLKARGEAEEFLAPSKTSSFAIYAFEEQALARHLDLELGLRAEGVWVEGTPLAGGTRTKSFAPLSGSVALVSHPWTSWSFGFTGLVGQRAPSQVELFARGPHEATATFEIGDPGLDEETSYTGEIRITGVVNRFRIETAAFVTHYRDFIFGSLTGRTVDEDGDPAGDELEEILYEDRNALFYGGEAQLQIDLFQVLDGLVTTTWQADFVRARFTNGDGNKNIPRITPVRWGGRIGYEHDRIRGHFGFLRTEAQNHGAENEFETDSFTMLELSARYRLPFFEGVVPLEIGMTAKNLLDESARNAVSFNKDEVQLAGRSFLFSIRARF